MLTQRKPTAADMAPYDLVIWSQPHASPGYIDAWGALSEYLEQGGGLFISGEDIGYFDSARDEYLSYLNASYLDDNSQLETIVGVEGEILAGIELDYNTPDSAQNQTSPDMIALGNARSRALQNTRGGYLLSLRGDSCVFRTIYLSYGLEGVGPAAAARAGPGKNHCVDAAESSSQGSGPHRADPRNQWHDR